MIATLIAGQVLEAIALGAFVYEGKLGKAIGACCGLLGLILIIDFYMGLA